MTATSAADTGASQTSQDAAQTHSVFNQVPDLAHYNLFASDPGLRAALDRLGGGWHAGQLSAFGSRLGDPEVQAWAADANRLTPELHTHSRTGERIDAVRSRSRSAPGDGVSAGSAALSAPPDARAGGPA